MELEQEWHFLTCHLKEIGNAKLLWSLHFWKLEILSVLKLAVEVKFALHHFCNWHSSLCLYLLR